MALSLRRLPGMAARNRGIVSAERLPDGTTVFLCGRNTGKTLSQEERMARWIEEESANQARCPLCLSPVEDRCGEADGGCQQPRASIAQAYAILKGMTIG